MVRTGWWSGRVGGQEEEEGWWSGGKTQNGSDSWTVWGEIANGKQGARGSRHTAGMTWAYFRCSATAPEASSIFSLGAAPLTFCGTA